MEENYSGIIEDPRNLEEKMLDYVMGAETGVVSNVRLPDGDWTKILIHGERQSSTFDMMFCTNMSSGHCIEGQMIWLIENGAFEGEALKFFEQFYLTPGDVKTFRVSKTFNAILSGTTKNGNWFQKVWQTWRETGMIPQSMMPELAANKWEDCMDIAKVTPELREMGKQSLKYVSIMYESVNGYDREGGFNAVEKAKTVEALKEAPLNIGIPIAASHAITMLKFDDDTYKAMDHYVPFFRTNNAVTIPVNFAFKGVVQVRKDIPNAMQKPSCYLTVPFGYGTKSSTQVRLLQDVLKYENFMSKNVPSSGNFLDITAVALKKWQVAHGINDFINEDNIKNIRVGLKTIAEINKIYAK